MAPGRILPGGFQSIAVNGTEHIGDRDYFVVDYFGRPVLLRRDDDGSIVTYDRQAGAEKPWLALGQPEGSSFPTVIDPCSSTGTILDRAAKVSIPAGDFTGAIQVAFRGNCADAGITQQFYAAGVGLVSHEETSIAGPRVWELVYYRAGDRTGTRPEVSFTLALDAARYAPGGTVDVRFTLRSTNPDPVALVFPSGQIYDVKIYDESGKTVYTWSAGRLFAQIVRDEKFGPGERTYGVAVPLGDLPPGRYLAQAYLTTSPPTYSAEAAFEIAK